MNEMFSNSYVPVIRNRDEDSRWITICVRALERKRAVNLKEVSVEK